MNRKKLFVLILAILLATQLPHASAADAAVLEISTKGVYFTAGQENTITIELKNTGDYEITDIQAILSSTTPELNIIQNAQKPVMTIKPLSAGRLLPVVGLSFVWNTIRDQDLVTIGTTTPDEARESIEISLDLLHRRLPENELQKTRSKSSLE